VRFQKDPNTDLFTWIDGGLIKVFYGSGDLQSITHPYGEYLLFEYDETGSRPELNKVIHSSGAELTIHYDSAGRIDAIDDPAGNTYDYGYNVNDTDGNLDYVIRPAPSGTQSVSYEYLTGTSNPNRLKQILHSDTGQFAQFGYADTIGRASYTRRGNFVHSTERYDLAVKTYAPDLVIETTNPHGKKTEYTYQTIAGLKRLTRVDGISHGSCAASNSVYTYDAIGHIDTVTDEEGIVTDYDYNDFGLVESITRDGRTVTYQWDPIYNLPTMTSTDLLDVEIQLGELDSSESGRIKKIIQTSKAASPYVQNQTRIWDYTYDLYSDGTIERITIDGPLAGNNDRIVYEYDTKGLLQEQVQYTTATEKLTTLFQNYDPHGRVGKIVYPSGMERTFTYHPRGFVGTVTDKVNGIDRQTSFEYYASGDLKKVTYTNGSSQEFDYDPARRVKEVSDNENNKVKYARDAASNVTSLQFSREDMGLVYVPPASCEPWDLEYPFCQGSWQWQVSDVLEYSVDYEFSSVMGTFVGPLASYRASYCFVLSCLRRPFGVA